MGRRICGWVDDVVSSDGRGYRDCEPVDSTAGWVRLPRSPLLRAHVMRAGLAFVEGDYKVVGIMIPCWWRRDGAETVDRLSVKIYSLRDRCWRSIELTPPFLGTMVAPRLL
ncbi:hypothetical protein Droror1_Dr00010703 [Drosera rotundifolia]